MYQCKGNTRVLAVSSDNAVLEEISAALGVETDYRLIICQSEQQAIARLHEVQAHLIICDADLIADEAGAGAAVIGKATSVRPGTVVMNSVFGGARIVDMLVGEQLPRIC